MRTISWSNLAELYNDTQHITIEPHRGAWAVHPWFSDTTAYLPIICATLKRARETAAAIRDAVITAGNAAPKIETRRDEQ